MYLVIVLFLFFYSLLVILEKTIRIPRSLSVKANSILKGFLNKNPADRLGCNRESGFAEIMSHQFFRNYIDWELVSKPNTNTDISPFFQDFHTEQKQTSDAVNFCWKLLSFLIGSAHVSTNQKSSYYYYMTKF